MLSGRHDNVDQSQFGRPTAYGTSPSTESFRSAFTGRAGSDLHDAIGFGALRYRTPRRSIRNSAPTWRPCTPLVPTTGQLGEVGIKYQPSFIPLSFTASLFDLTRAQCSDDRSQHSPPNVDPDRRGPFARLRGRDVGLHRAGPEGAWAPTPGYNLRTTESNDPDADRQSTDRLHHRILAPCSFDYTIPGRPARRLRGRCRTTLRRRLLRRCRPTPYGLPGYVVADANLHYDREHWRAALNVHNVFDRTVVSDLLHNKRVFLRCAPHGDPQPRLQMVSAVRGAIRDLAALVPPSFATSCAKRWTSTTDRGAPTRAGWPNREASHRALSAFAMALRRARPRGAGVALVDVLSRRADRNRRRPPSFAATGSLSVGFAELGMTINPAGLAAFRLPGIGCHAGASCRRFDTLVDGTISPHVRSRSAPRATACRPASAGATPR